MKRWPASFVFFIPQPLDRLSTVMTLYFPETLYGQALCSVITLCNPSFSLVNAIFIFGDPGTDIRGGNWRKIKRAKSVRAKVWREREPACAHVIE